MIYEVKIIDGESIKIHTVIVHRFTISDIDDPDIFMAETIYNWQKTELGSWVMEHAIEKPVWLKQINFQSYGYDFAIKAKLKERDYLIYLMKWA